MERRECDAGGCHEQGRPAISSARADSGRTRSIESDAPRTWLDGWALWRGHSAEQPFAMAGRGHRQRTRARGRPALEQGSAIDLNEPRLRRKRFFYRRNGETETNRVV